MAEYSLSNKMLLLLPLLLFFWAHFSPSHFVRGKRWENLTVASPSEGLPTDPKDDKYYYFDESGSLIVNVKKPGNSPPIVIDTKKYYPACTTNVYYTFIFTVNIDASMFNNVFTKYCDTGMIICYEGQLVGEHLRSEYLVPNLADKNNDKEQIDMITKCVQANGNKLVGGIRGLRVAIKSAYVSEVEKNEDVKMPGNEFVVGSFRRFFVLSGSFFKESIAFPVPKDGSLILQIGNRNDLGIKFMDADGRPVLPLKIQKSSPPASRTTEPRKPEDVLLGMNIEYVKVTMLGTKALVAEPDLSNGARLSDHRGLWMLYLDFKSDYRSWQAISTIHPPKSDQCNMTLEIRGNRMRPCRSYYEDVAILEPVNAYMRMVYTQETGTVRQQKHGQEDMKATATRMKKEQMRMQASRDQTQDTNDRTTVTDDILESISSKEKTVTTEHINRGESEISLNANPAKAVADQASKNAGGGEQDGAQAKVGVGASWEERSWESSSTKDVHTNTQTTRNTDKMFSDVTKAKTMMNNFKSTSGEAETMEQGTFMQSETAFNTRETLDVTVELPPNTKLIIRQLMFDCDGNLVKLPFIEYVNGESGEKLKLPESNSGDKISVLDSRWNNTLADENCYRPSCMPKKVNKTKPVDKEMEKHMLLAQEQLKFQAKVEKMLDEYPGN